MVKYYNNRHIIIELYSIIEYLVNTVDQSHQGCVFNFNRTPLTPDKSSPEPIISI